LKALPILTDKEPDFQAASTLARVFGLSFYGALNLELAKRANTELATLDGALGKAAVTERVRLSVA
jgi:predicted nucleic acid-binding protein